MEKRKGSATMVAVLALVVAVLLMLGLVRASAAAGPAVYTVGDSAGWTIIGNVNYTAWAAAKKFRVGDLILFVYNNNFHNVMEVSKADYKACNAASPLATHKSGNDSFAIKRAGHHFFICGVPGHCAIGQKVDIRVPKGASSAAPSPSPSPSPATSPSAGGGAIGAGGGASATPVSSPRPNGAAAAVAPPAVLGLALAVFAFVAASAAVS